MSDCAPALISSSLIAWSGWRTNTVATRDTGSTGTTAAIPSRKLASQPFYRLEAHGRIEGAEVDPVAFGVRAHRDGRAEVHARVAEAVPAPAQPKGHLVRDESQQGQGDERPAAGDRRLRVAFPDEGPILQHPVIVEPDGNEHEVPVALRVEPRNHVVDEAELRAAQAPVAAEAALGIHRLDHSRGRRRPHVAGEHLAVEGVARIAAHEVRPSERTSACNGHTRAHSPTA